MDDAGPCSEEMVDAVSECGEIVLLSKGEWWKDFEAQCLFCGKIRSKSVCKCPIPFRIE